MTIAIHERVSAGNGTLLAERFASVTTNGKRYTIANGTPLGLFPHRDGVFSRKWSFFRPLLAHCRYWELL